jgi:RNA polymerase sigma-70 factor (ECF subfamily)
MNHGSEEFAEQVVLVLPRLRRFARALTHHPADADDLVQLAVERALIRREQWQPGTSLVNWMLTIVRNAWIDETRLRQRRALVVAPSEDAEQMGDQGMEPALGLWSIQAALGTLPDEQRLAVALVLVEGLSYREAAEIMQVPMGTLTSRLARGRQALQSMLLDGERVERHGDRSCT